MGGWTPRWVGASDRRDRVILLTLLIGLLGYIDADDKLLGCIVGLLAMDSTVDNPESRKKNGATEEGAIFTPRSVRLYKGMLIASIEEIYQVCASLPRLLVGLMYISATEEI